MMNARPKVASSRLKPRKAQRAGGVLLAALVMVIAVSRPATAQGTADKPQITDTWQGTLHVADHELRTVVKIERPDGGPLKGTLYSIDQGGQGIPMSSIGFQDGVLKYAIERIDGAFEGKMSADGKSIVGQFKQGPSELPLVLIRATPETAWAIPEAPKRLPQMPADADPSFEVATIKPSKPDAPGKGFRVQGDHVTTTNTTLMDLIKFAYGMQDKQVLGLPAWASTEKYDIAAQPDLPGSPNTKQLRSMMQKLIVSRFALKFHRGDKELSAYVLTVGKTGPKLTKSKDDPNGLGGLFFQGLGVLMVTNSDMPAFCGLMQEAVLDRPVVDQTGLRGKFDFRLKWTPDESQFGGMKMPPPSDAADAPPPLFVAVQEQLGLKLEASKAHVPVLILDNVAKPTEN